MLDDIKLSDLFFNHEHPEYDALRRGSDNDPEGNPDAALRKDADTFAADYPEFGKDGDWYAKDFFRRL